MSTGVAGRRGGIALASILALPFSACTHSPPAGSKSDAASADGPDASHPPPRASSSRAYPPPHASSPPPCMAATVVGSVTVVPLVGVAPLGGGTPLLDSSAVPEDAWIDIGNNSRLTARDAVSTREATYVGPGRFRVCVGNREESWALRGVFESVGGAGERPGGEEWVATPLGVARYDVAKWTLTVTDRAVEVHVTSGTGYLWSADGVTTRFSAEAGAPPALNDQGWVRLNGAASANLTVNAPVLTEQGAEAAMSRCSSAAREAKDLATRIGAPDAGLGELAPRHIVARRLAHAACGVAHLRIESLPFSPARDGYLERVRAADAEWKTLGPPPSLQGPF